MYLVGFINLGSLGMVMQAGNNGLMKMEKSNRNSGTAVGLTNDWKKRTANFALSEGNEKL